MSSTKRTSLSANTKRNVRVADRDKNINFYKGQLHHVGCLYDLKRDDRPFRVMVSGAEYAKAKELISVKKRTEIITELNPGNPHMRGTLCLLQMLFGQESQNGKLETATINGESRRILAAFSLANFLLCRAAEKNPTGKEGPTGDPTEPMLKNCSNHFQRTIEILQPQMIILQGVRARDFFWEHYKIDLNYANPKIETIEVFGKPILVLPLHHPSYRKKAWGGAGYSTIQTYVKPAVDKLLKAYDEL